MVKSIAERGGLKITIGRNRHYFADVGDIFEISAGTIHRAEGKGEIIELSFEDLDTYDSDILRIEDSYDRANLTGNSDYENSN